MARTVTMAPGNAAPARERYDGDAGLDRARLRADTPGCRKRVHLNNAGGSLPPRPVVDAVIGHLRLEEELGGHEAADAVADDLRRGREDLAALVGSQSVNLALVESSTVALHRVLSTVPLRRGDRVLVAAAEYGSTILPLLQLSGRMGLHVEVIPDGPDGTTDPAALQQMLDDDVRMVSVVQAPSHNGLVNDVDALGGTLRQSGSDAWFVVDACQALGQLPVSASASRADFLFASGRKFLRGPRGTGLLAVSDRVLTDLDAFPVDVHGAEWTHDTSYRVDPTARRFETFERSYANSMGLIRAARYAGSHGMDPIGAAIRRNAEYLRSHIGSLPGWNVLDRGPRRSGIVTVRHRAVPAAGVRQLLADRGITVSVVRAAMNPVDLQGRDAVRLSPHAYNHGPDLDQALAALRSVA